MSERKTVDRAEAAVAAVLPSAVRIQRVRKNLRSVGLEVNGAEIKVEWLGEGGLRQVRERIANEKNRPDIAVARRMSPGAREVLSAAGIGWVDETGAAEIVLGPLVVSRSGRPPEAARKAAHWTASVLATAEALFCGKLATVDAIQKATGLSVGSAAYALHTLAALDLLGSEARRGRNSARLITDPDRLLDEYATAAASMMSTVRLTTGMVGRDLEEGLGKIGQLWKSKKVAWAATGPFAASVLAPYLTRVLVADVYVDAATIPELEVVAEKGGLKPIEGGRVILRPFPTVATRRLMDEKDGLSHAPWSRVYADLRGAGVRGEEAAEHLRDAVWNPVEVVSYVLDRDSAEVIFNIFGKKYQREVKSNPGRVMWTRSDWVENQSKVTEKALGLLLNEHKELTDNLQIYGAITKMRNTLSGASGR